MSGASRLMELVERNVLISDEPGADEVDDQ
jgi:hypothetical protein